MEFLPLQEENLSKWILAHFALTEALGKLYNDLLKEKPSITPKGFLNKNDIEDEYAFLLTGEIKRLSEKLIVLTTLQNHKLKELENTEDGVSS